MQLNPKALHGSWEDGRTLDLHVRSSEFLGDDNYGHPQFHTIRTELGELLYRLKYRGDRSAIEPIAQTAADFIREWHPGVDLIIPTPPSKTPGSSAFVPDRRSPSLDFHASRTP